MLRIWNRWQLVDLRGKQTLQGTEKWLTTNENTGNERAWLRVKISKLCKTWDCQAMLSPGSLGFKHTVLNGQGTYPMVASLVAFESWQQVRWNGGQAAQVSNLWIPGLFETPLFQATPCQETLSLDFCGSAKTCFFVFATIYFWGVWHQSQRRTIDKTLFWAQVKDTIPHFGGSSSPKKTRKMAPPWRNEIAVAYTMPPPENHRPPNRSWISGFLLRSAQSLDHRQRNWSWHLEVKKQLPSLVQKHQTKKKKKKRPKFDPKKRWMGWGTKHLLPTSLTSEMPQGCFQSVQLRAWDFGLLAIGMLDEDP